MASARSAAGDRLRHVAARAGADDGDDVLGGVGDRQGEEPRAAASSPAARGGGPRRRRRRACARRAARRPGARRDESTASATVGRVADDRRRGPRARRARRRGTARGRRRSRRGGRAHGRAPVEHELDLRAAAGRGVDRRAAAVALHPPDDRLAHAAAVGGHGVEVEARAAVADEDLRRPSAASAYTATGAPPPNLAALTHRLARGGDEGLAASSSAASPTATTSIGTPWSRSTSSAAASSGREPALAGAVRVVRRQPRAQLALLAAGERGDLARIARALLDEGERLQDRVVQVGGDLGALLGADALGPLGRRASATSRTIQGAKMTPNTSATTTAASTTSRAAPSAPVVCRKTIPAAMTSATPMPVREMSAARDWRRAAPAPPRSGRKMRRRPRSARRSAALRPSDRRGAARRPMPDQRAAGRDERPRPDDHIGEREPQLAKGEQDGEQEESDAQPDLDRARGAVGGRSASRTVPVLRLLRGMRIQAST